MVVLRNTSKFAAYEFFYICLPIEPTGILKSVSVKDLKEKYNLGWKVS